MRQRIDIVREHFSTGFRELLDGCVTDVVPAGVQPRLGLGGRSDPSSPLTPTVGTQKSLPIHGRRYLSYYLTRDLYSYRDKYGYMYSSQYFNNDLY